MYIIAVCLAFATCSKVEQEVDPSPESPTSFKKGQKVTLSYTTDVQSKVSSSIDASGISFTWEEGDKILVSVGGSTGTFTLTKGAGTATAEFSGEMPADGTTFDVQYPTSTPSLSSQTYQAGNLPKDKVLFTASGCQLGQSYTLNNQSAVVCFNLTGEKSVGSIVFNSCTLSCGGVALSNSPTSFYMVVPTGTYSFNVDVKDTNGTTICSFASSGTKTFSANSCLNLATKDVQPVLVNKITISPSSVTETYAKKNETKKVQLSALVEPNNAYSKAVKWETNSDKFPVSADGTECEVTIPEKKPNVPSTATITCTALDGSGFSKTCTITLQDAIVAVTDVTINESAPESLAIGATCSFTCTVAPEGATDKTVTWSSSNSAIASVDQTGKVTGVAEGNCTIECKSNSNTSIKATRTIKVVKVPVSSITLNPQSISMDKASSYDPITIEATILPDNATNREVIWSSNNESLVTVKDGTLKITTDTTGEAIITCSATDDSGKSATCKVTIVEKSIKVTGITLNTTTIEGAYGEIDPVTLTATIAPEDATAQDVNWVSNNTDVATITPNGTQCTVTIVGGGEATITCSATDDSGKSATCSVKVEEKVSSITLNPSSITVFQDNTSTFNITATVNRSSASNQNVEWASDNTNVVTVSEDPDNNNICVVTVKAPGTANITCTAKDGSEKSATCEVTVKKLVTEIKLTPDGDVQLIGDTKSVDISVSEVKPEGASRSFTWALTGKDAGNFSLSSNTGESVRVTYTGTANNVSCEVVCTAVDGKPTGPDKKMPFAKKKVSYKKK